MVDIAQQRGKLVMVEHHGKGRHSRSSVETTVMAQQRGNGSHSGASWKMYRHSAAALKK